MRSFAKERAMGMGWDGLLRGNGGKGRKTIKDQREHEFNR